MIARFLTHRTAARNLCLAILGLLLAIPLALTLFLTLFLALALLLIAQPTEGQGAPRPCTHWAAPTGSGSACTDTAPCRVADAWPQIRAGSTLCLMDGMYRRSQGGSIDPPDTLAGTADQPITVRALNDGQVTIDAEHTGFVVFLQTGNDYWRIEGINGTNGKEAGFRSRANHTRFSRIIAYNGTDGQADSQGISMSGPGVDQVCIDCAVWGTNMRKNYEFSQSQAPGQDMLGSGCRRCWGEWNDHPGGVSCPNNTYQIGYRSRGQIWENIIGTFDVRGTVCDYEGMLGSMYGCNETNLDIRAKVLGALMYSRNANAVWPTPGSTTGIALNCSSNLLLRDVVSFISSKFTTIRPFRVDNYSTPNSPTPESNNVCDNCLAVHAGTPSVINPQAGWTFPNFHEGNGLTAATGGVSPFLLLPGLCYRYEGGVLTNSPLWPWPMDSRIRAARIASGAPEVEVTSTVEALLGPIPAACKTGGTPPAGDQVPPQVSVTAPRQGQTLTLPEVVVAAEATDNVGVVGVQFLLDGAPLQAEDTVPPHQLAWNTTGTAPGQHTMAAIARDAAGNTTTSQVVTFTFQPADGGECPVCPECSVCPAPGTGALTCTGALKDAGVITLECQPTTR